MDNNLIREAVKQSIKNHLNEKEEDNELVDDVVTALKSADVDPEVLNAKKNFNVSFKVGDTEYFVRPNDKGDEMYYIDSDSDDYNEVKVKDNKDLTKKVKKIKS